MRNFEETINYIYTLLPVYQNKGTKAYKPGLGNIVELSECLNHPHKFLQTIHVAGTNGKGSVSHMLSSVFQEAGLKVGLYTSPHLVDFRERIKINGEMMPKDRVVSFVAEVEPIIHQVKPSFFELTVAMAFQYFKEQKVDLAIIETGLGGRFDSTNIITPNTSVITNIGLDHTALLGDTLEKIAFEKAGIIKVGIPVVVGKKQKECFHVFEKKAEDSNAKLHLSDAALEMESELKGEYQKENIATVVKTINVQTLYKITDNQIKEGIKKVCTNTKLRGRWEVLSEKPKIICDTGHNESAWNFLSKQIATEQAETRHFVLGFVDDKDVDSILNFMPKDAKFYFCQPSVMRGMDINRLKLMVAKFDFDVIFYPNVEQAYESAKKNASNKDLIFIGGSTFVVADLIKKVG